MTLTLPFVAHLRDHILNRRMKSLSPPDTHYFTNVTEERLNLTYDRLVRVEAQMFFQEMVSEQDLQGDREKAEAALDRVRRRAVRAIAHHTYGPIEAELREILILLWRDGMAKSEAAKRIDAMLPILRGEE